MNHEKNILHTRYFHHCSNIYFSQAGWQSLFNGKNLDNWDKYIGSALRGFDDLKENATPEKVFPVIEKNDEKLIRISGEVNASLATKESFENYHLQLVFKWGEKVFTSRNSGLLYHSSGDFGAAFGTWMACIEHQLMHDNPGDTYLMVNTNCGYYDGDKIKPLSSGKIQIQSEGGELFIKSIKIESIKKLPEKILK